MDLFGTVQASFGLIIGTVFCLKVWWGCTNHCDSPENPHLRTYYKEAITKSRSNGFEKTCMRIPKSNQTMAYSRFGISKWLIILDVVNKNGAMVG